MEEKQYPLIGPATYEEAISRIEAAEKEIEEGQTRILPQCDEYVSISP